MSAIEKLCLSSSANDFHVSLDIIFWREGSFFNYAEQILSIISPTTYLPLVDIGGRIPLLLHILWKICIMLTFPVSLTYLLFLT